MGQAISQIANDIRDGISGVVSGAKDIASGRVSEGLKKAAHGVADMIPGGEILYRAAENHPMEVAAIAAIIATAGAATPGVAAAETGAAVGTEAGAGTAAQSLAAGGEALGGGLKLGAAGAQGITAGAATETAGALGSGLLPEAGKMGALELGNLAPATMGGATGGLIGSSMGTPTAATTAAPSEAVATPSVTTPSDLVTPQAESEWLSSVQNYASPQTDPSTMDKILQWADKHPNIAQGILTAGGATLGGAALGAFQYAGMEKKAELDKETLLELARQKPAIYRQFVQQSSAGGIGVQMPFSAQPTQPLLRPGGQPVFKNGIINRVGG